MALQSNFCDRQTAPRCNVLPLKEARSSGVLPVSSLMFALENRGSSSRRMSPWPWYACNTKKKSAEKQVDEQNEEMEYL